MNTQTDRVTMGYRSWKISVLLMLLFFICSTSAFASQSVFLVMSSEAKPYQQAADALRSSLQKHGMLTRLFLSEKIAANPPDFSSDTYKNKVWVSIGSRAAALLYDLLPPSTPLVYCMVADPEKVGLEGTRKYVTGVSVTKPVREQFCIIQKAMPDLHSIGMLYRSSSEKSMQTLVEVNTCLPPGWNLEAVDVDQADSMSQAIGELFNRDIDLIWTMADSAIYNRATVNSLLLSSLRQKVPVFGFSGSFVKAGALLGLEADPALQGEYAATLVLKSGGGDLAEDSISSGVIIAVNLVVADRLGITLSPDVVDQSCIIGNR